MDNYKDNYNEAMGSMTSYSIATDIPLEIFANICKYLPPSILFKLTSVCKQYRKYLISLENQDIWRTSRLGLLSYPKLPPPPGMTEQDYIKLTAAESGCRFCGTRKSEIKFYWMFRVRCCNKCYKFNIG